MLTSSWGHSNHLGNLASKVLKMQTLDLPEGISELKSLAVVDIGGLQVSSGRRRGRPFLARTLVEADTEEGGRMSLSDPVLALYRWSGLRRESVRLRPPMGAWALSIGSPQWKSVAGLEAKSGAGIGWEARVYFDLLRDCFFFPRTCVSG